MRAVDNVSGNLLGRSQNPTTGEVNWFRGNGGIWLLVSATTIPISTSFSERFIQMHRRTFACRFACEKQGHSAPLRRHLPSNIDVVKRALPPNAQTHFRHSIGYVSNQW